MREPEWIKDMSYPFILEEVNKLVFLAWVGEFNIDGIYSGLPLWPKMHGRKFQQISEVMEEEDVPYSRQCEMYEKLNGDRLLVVHFYEDIPSEDIEVVLDEFMEKRGLKAEWLSYDESWLNPGVSLTAVLEICDVGDYIAYIDKHRKYDEKLNKHWI